LLSPKYGKLFQGAIPFPIFNLPVSISNPGSPGYKIRFKLVQLVDLPLFNCIVVTAI
jgi:hypothetical protein